MLKVTLVEAIDQFHAEGEDETVKQLITEWRTRLDTLRAAAHDDMERMQASGALPRGPLVGPGGSVSPFPRRN